MRSITLAIPTYNRASLLNQQLERLFKTIDPTPYQAKILVCDNCSTDNTFEVCKLWKNKSKNEYSNIEFEYKKNTINLGLIGNVISCIKNSTTDLVWVIGDDDAFLEGGIKEVLKTINATDKDFYALNYQVINGITHKIEQSSFLPQKALNMDNLQPIHCLSEGGRLDLFMFITANIIAKSKAMDAINTWEKGTHFLAFPLFINLYVALSSSFYVIKKPIFGGVYYVNSWKKYAAEVSFLQIPLVVKKLEKINLINKSHAAITKKYSFFNRQLVKVILKKPSLLKSFFSIL